MAQQRAFAGGADAVDRVERVFADGLCAPGAMAADRETMRFVAQALQIEKRRVVRFQHEGRAAWDVEILAPRVAVRSFRDRSDGHVDDARRLERIERRGELPRPAVDQHQVGPVRGILRRVVGIGRGFVEEGCCQVAVRLRRHFAALRCGRRLFLRQPCEAA